MCSFGSSQSAPSTQYSTQTTTADPRAAQMYGQAWQQAQQTAQRPFNPYSYDPNAFVAPMNSTQLTAVNNIYGQQNAGQPFYQQAGQMAYNAGNTSSAGLAGAYMSPYLNSVAASTMGILGQQQAQDRNRLSGQIASNGQWGNDRSGIERATLAGQQNLASANTISNLYNQGYNTALGAAQTDLNRQLQASGSLAGQGLQGAQSLLQAGTLGQQTQQAGLQALYNQYLMQQQYPFQTAQFLASTAAGLGPGYGGTTSGYQSSQQPLSFFGNPLSDPHLKVGAEGDEPEVIGQTNDGQEIYRYRVINPDTGEVGPVQIGLMADEVEQRRPDAIGDYKGFRTVDYAKATDDAARLGGGVMGRGDYADGGGIDDLLRSHEAMYAGLGKMPGGIVPQSQMATAKLDAPTIKFADMPKREGYGLGQMASDVEGAKKLYDQGKSLYEGGKGLANWFSDKSLLSGPSAEIAQGYWKKADGGSVYDDTPEMTQGPTATQMPTAKLNAPELSFGSSGQNKQGTGIGDMVKGAAGLASAAKTLWDIGSTVGPAVMAMSDRRLKTGVRPGHATTGGVKPSDDGLDDEFVNRLLGQESGGKQFDKDGNPLTSSKGAVGIAQIMPGTMPEAARYAGVEPSMERLRNDPDYNKALGRAYLKHQMEQFGGDREMALGAYNAGPSRVERAVAKANINGGDWKDYLPHETQAYIPAIMGKGLGRAMAYAGSEGTPKNAGIEAINAATKPGGVVPSDDTAPAQGISGFLRGAPASGLGEKALDFATSERFLIPLLTGLGTMASSGSRYLAPAVLQGLGAGAKEYLEVPKVQSEIMKNTLGIAATRFKPLENGNFYDNVLGREVSAQERASAMSSMFNGTLGGSAVSGSTPYSAPSAKSSTEPAIDRAKDTAKEVAAPIGLPATSVEKGSSAAASEILAQASKDPSVMEQMQRASQYEAEANKLLAMPWVEGASERATALRTLAAQHRAQAIEIRNKLAEPDMAALKVTQERTAAAPFEMIEVQPEPGGPTYSVPKSSVVSGAGIPKGAAVSKQPAAFEDQQKQLAASKATMAANAQARMGVRERLNTLSNILETYETGKFAEQKADIVATLRSLGIPVKDTDTASPEKFQEFVKNATATIFQQAAGLGGPVLKSELEGLAKANPNPGMQPGANRQILGQAIGLLDWEDKHYSDFVDHFSAPENRYSYDTSKFERDWLKSNPTKDYVKRATLGIAAKGEPAPPKDKLEVGYSTVRNGVKWTWDGTQFVKGN